MENLSTDDLNLLEEFHISHRILDELPEWMIKWISLILRFISQETKSSLIELDNKMFETDFEEIYKVVYITNFFN